MTTMPMFYGYMDSPFIPLPPPWVDPAESQATAKACKHFCCKARSKTDIALTVFRVFGFVFSIVMLTLGVTVFEMPHTFGSYPADNIIFITVVGSGFPWMRWYWSADGYWQASITCLFSLLETCCFTEGVKYPVSRGI